MILPLLTAAMLTGAQAPSFDCTKAASFAERTVCVDAALAAEDRALTQIYRQARPAAPGLVDSQRAWISERDLCADKPCVQEAYGHRILELAYVTRYAGWSSFLRSDGRASLRLYGVGAWTVAFLDFWNGNGRDEGFYAVEIPLVFTFRRDASSVVIEPDPPCTLAFAIEGRGWSVTDAGRCYWSASGVDASGYYFPA